MTHTHPTQPPLQDLHSKFSGLEINENAPDAMDDFPTLSSSPSLPSFSQSSGEFPGEFGAEWSGEGGGEGEEKEEGEGKRARKEVLGLVEIEYGMKKGGEDEGKRGLTVGLTVYLYINYPKVCFEFNLI